MKRFVLFVPLVLGMLVFASFFSSVAHAAGGPPPILGFHVEDQMLHCIKRVLPCNTPSTATNSLYTNVEVDSFTPGKTRGTPDAVVLACGYAYFDQHNNFHDVSEHVIAGFEPGTIRGYVELEGNYHKDSTYAIAEIEYLVAHDNVTGDTAWVNGRTVSNNVTALRVSGGFYLRMYGPIYDEYTDAQGNNHSTKVATGWINCNSATSYVKAPFASGPYFVAYLGNSPH